MKSVQITQWCHEILRSQVKEGGFYIDATMGKGMDTLFLCELAGDTGSVLAFDVQKQALDMTEELLRKKGMDGRARLILDGHEHMGQYAAPGSVDAICFNFGYLPGGDHSIATTAETSVKAVREGLKLLKPGGMMSLCIYSGGDTGFEEKEKLLELLKALPSDSYTVILQEYYNRDNNPPLPAFVFRNEGKRGREKRQREQSGQI